MRQLFVWLNSLAYALGPWRLQKTVLAFSCVALGWLPGQAQAVIACGSAPPTLSLFSDTSRSALSGDQTFKYPLKAGETVFSGYVKYAIADCNGTPMTFTSRLISGLVNGNTGLTVTPTGVALSSCDPHTSTSTSVTATGFGPTGKWSCTMQFKFTITTNTDAVLNAKSTSTSIALGQKLVASAADAYWVYSPDAFYDRGRPFGTSLPAPFALTFDPKSCHLTSTASTVYLGSTTTSAAKNPSESDWKTFALEFSGCGAAASAYSIHASFDYTPYDIVTNPNLIKSTGNASAMGVELAKNDGTVIVKGTTYVLATTSSGITSYSVPMKARMRAAAGLTPGAGNVSATATFTVTYN